jgi:8-oxo-dGTP pyrophosphatase MutT (NUDIX family)
MRGRAGLFMISSSMPPPDQRIETTVIPVERLELAFAPRPWPFAQERRSDIAAHFAALRRDNPALWNGRVLMLHRHEIKDGVFHGAYLETDFASMLAWRHWNFPDPDVRNCFGMAALRASDGAFVLGIMAEHTANAGWIYFPAGVPDLSDVDGARVDLARSLMREASEETGLPAGELHVDNGWTTVLAGARVAQIRIVRVEQTAHALTERILAHLAQEAQPELAGIRMVRSPGDFDPMMPPYVTAFLRHVWSRAE